MSALKHTNFPALGQLLDLKKQHAFIARRITRRMGAAFIELTYKVEGRRKLTFDRLGTYVVGYEFSSRCLDLPIRGIAS